MYHLPAFIGDQSYCPFKVKMSTTSAYTAFNNCSIKTTPFQWLNIKSNLSSVYYNSVDLFEVKFNFHDRCATKNSNTVLPSSPASSLPPSTMFSLIGIFVCVFFCCIIEKCVVLHPHMLVVLFQLTLRIFCYCIDHTNLPRL